jgi:hypothetical protein
MLIFIFGIQAIAQLSGTKNIPGDYASIESAINSLNVSGVGSGGVKFNVAASYTETAPSGGFLITATGTATDAIIFRKNGIGSNPVITAAILLVSTNYDAVVKIAGGDYITFDGIDIVENTANTTNLTDWGYALLKGSSSAPVDGCQYVTIKNCNISLNKTNLASIGIYAGNHISTSTTTLTTLTASTDAMNNCKFFNNTISNVYGGISITGYNAASPFILYDANNEIGLEGANTITNFGGANTSTRGIYASNQKDLKVANNIINSSLNGLSNSAYGIFTQNGNASNIDIFNNTISLSITSGSFTQSVYAIYNTIGSTANSNTVNIYNNSIINCNLTAATSGNLQGITNTGAASSVNIYENTISSNILAGSGNFTGIFNNANLGSNPLNIYSNIIINNSKTGASGNMYCSQAVTGSINYYLNSIHDNSAAGTAFIYGYSNFGAPVTETYRDNNIYNLSVNGAGTVHAFQLSSSATGVKNIYGNNIYALIAGGNVNGISSITGSPSNIYKNNIYNLSSSGAGSQAIGINYAGSTGNIYNNFISDLRATASTNTLAVVGINLGGSLQNLYYNTIYLNASSSSISTFGSAGIYKLSTTICDLRNNIIANNSIPGTAGGSYTVAFRNSGVYNSAYYAVTSNNNCFYAGTASASNLIYYDGSNANQTIADFQTLVTPRDIASFNEMPPFVNIITAPYNLHLKTDQATACESGGLKITTPSITEDFDNNLRWGEVGYAGSGSTTDVGADEFEGIPNYNCGLPIPGNTIASENVLCIGNSTQLSLQNTITQTGIDYQWSSSTDSLTYTTISGATASTYTATPLENSFFKCIVNCKNGPVTASSTPVKIYINPLPSASGLISGTDTICTGQSNLVYAISPVLNANSYIWAYSGTGANISGSDTNVSIDFSSIATSGNLTVKAHNSCGDGIISTDFPITVNAVPAAADSISGSAIVCQGSSNNIYSIPLIANATTYNWFYSGSGASFSVDSNRITISFTLNATSGNLTVYGSNDCGNGIISANFPITINAIPGMPANISGIDTVCQGTTGIAYNIAAINGATSYIWSYSGTGATINGTSDNITISFSNNATSGSLSVKGINSCGEGISSLNYSITVMSMPSASGIISGSDIACQGQTGLTYSVQPILNATSYIWTYTGLGSSITGSSNTVSLSLFASATSGNITVRGNNSCGNGDISVKYIAVFPSVENAGVITGNTTLCQGQNAVNYSIPIINNATSYIWTLPNGVTGSSSTNNITVNYTSSAVSGNITVKGNNSCSEGLASNLSVVVNPLPETGIISGNTPVCQGENAISYMIPALPNASSYIWTLPSGATGVSTTNSIFVNFGLSAISGNITVKGNNACGDGLVASLPITVHPKPANAGTITGPTNICYGQNAITYSIPVINNATLYAWTLPNGVLGSSDSNSITVDFGTSSVSGNVTVRGSNQCGNGNTAALAIHVSPLTVAAGVISGTATVCQGQNSLIYSVPTIANASSYIWTLPSGATSSGTTNSITVNFGISALSGNITVNGRNSCGDGTSSTKAITINPLPATPLNISGPTTVFHNQNSIIYGIAPTANTLSYVWTLPAGASGNSTTDSIVVNYGSSAVSGNITVKGINNCGSGSPAILPITVDPTENTIRLIVTGNTTSFTDEIIVSFGFANDQGGAEKMYSIYPTAPNLYSTKFNKKWSINYLTNIIQYEKVAVGFKAGVNGIYSISANDINSFSPLTYIYLKDLFTNSIADLNQNPVYTFTASKNDSVNRFQLLFSSLPVRWLGNTSANWNTTSNWSNSSLPSISENIFITSWAANQPHITSLVSSPVVCNNLTIKPGASLTIDAGKALTVNGTLTNLAGDSGIVLKSDASGTASILHATPNVNANVERFIPHTNPDEFHMLSSPVTAQAINPDFNEQNGFFVWNEPTDTWIEYADTANFTAVNGSNNFVPGIGYAVSYQNAVTKIFKGNLNQGSIYIPLTYTTGSYSGWNFIANPYPSSINWNATNGWNRNILSDAGNGEKAIWVWNAANGNYGAYISNSGAYGTNGVTSNIALSQGFWVKANSTGTLSMDNTVRIHSTHSFLKSTTASAEMLRLTVSGTANAFNDELIIQFGNANNQGGAEKMFSIDATAPGIYSIKSGKNWSINKLTSITDNTMIPVGFKAGVNGDYTIKVSDINSFTTPVYTYLKDMATNTLTDLNQHATYTFTASTTDNANRFQLLFVASPLSISNKVLQNTSIYAFDNVIYINSNETIQQISIYNTLGQLLKTVEKPNSKTVISMKEYAVAYYIVKVVTTKNVYAEKVMVK